MDKSTPFTHPPDDYAMPYLRKQVVDQAKRIEELEALCQFHIAESKKADEVVLKENAKLKAYNEEHQSISMLQDMHIAKLEAEIERLRGLLGDLTDRSEAENERLRAVLAELISMQHQPEEYRLNSTERARIALAAQEEPK